MQPGAPPASFTNQTCSLLDFTSDLNDLLYMIFLYGVESTVKIPVVFLVYSYMKMLRFKCVSDCPHANIGPAMLVSSCPVYAN